MHPRLEELFVLSEETRAELRAIVGTLTEDELTRKPPRGGWSAAEHLEHLAMVETGAARVAQKVFAKAKAAGLPPERETASVMRSLDQHGLAETRFAIEAPGFVVPQGAKTPAESMEQIASGRAATVEVLREGDGLDLTQVRLQHARLGELDLYQWLLFLSQHERRHARHIARIARELRSSDASTAAPSASP